MKKTLFLSLATALAFVSSANAALAIDTTAIKTDIGTASSAGIEITLLVAAAVVGISLIRKFIKG